MKKPSRAITKGPHKGMERTVEASTPKHLHNGFVPEIPGYDNRELQDDLAKHGYRIMLANAEPELALQLTRRFDFFAAEVKQSFEILAGKVLPLLTELRDDVKELKRRDTDHERRLHEHTQLHVEHGKRLDSHDEKHLHHEKEITSVISRLVMIETVQLTKQKRKVRRK